MIVKDDLWDSLYIFAKDLHDHRSSFNDIEEQLSKKCDDKKMVAEIMTQLKKTHYAVKRKQGMIKLGFAALFLVAGFFITCINFHSNQSFTIVMYTSSSIGLVFLFLALYDIIG